jgi:hypothetical protein
VGKISTNYTKATTFTQETFKTIDDSIVASNELNKLPKRKNASPTKSYNKSPNRYGSN